MEWVVSIRQSEEYKEDGSVLQSIMNGTPF